MKTKLVLVGFGEFGRELLNWYEHAYNLNHHEIFHGFIDDDLNSNKENRYSIKYLGKIEDYDVSMGNLVMSINDVKNKEIIAKKLKAMGGEFEKFIHPSAIIAKSASIGDGVIICPNALVSAGAEISDFCTINVFTSIGHDVKVGKYCTISSHVDLTGYVEIENSVFVGSNVSVIPKVKICNNSVIGAGTTIFRKVPPESTIFANFPKKL